MDAGPEQHVQMDMKHHSVFKSNWKQMFFFHASHIAQ